MPAKKPTDEQKVAKIVGQFLRGHLWEPLPEDYALARRIVASLGRRGGKNEDAELKKAEAAVVQAAITEAVCRCSSLCCVHIQRLWAITEKLISIKIGVTARKAGGRGKTK